MAGCDRLAISPELLSKLADGHGKLERCLHPANADSGTTVISEPQLRWEMIEDAMATEKLVEGIRNFHADAVKLAKIVGTRLLG